MEKDNQSIAAYHVPVHELFHIRHFEPVEAGSLLNHDAARQLVHAEMVYVIDGVYRTTAKGRHVIEKMVDYLSKLRVVSHDFPTVSISDNKE